MGEIETCPVSIPGELVKVNRMLCCSLLLLLTGYVSPSDTPAGDIFEGESSLQWAAQEGASPGGEGCCGIQCAGNEDCCAGTSCSQSGRCVPAVCDDCGAAGCLVDYESCEAVCHVPDCCLSACVPGAGEESGCCPGTECSEVGAGDYRCIPPGCDRCSGMHPTCQITTECQSVCIPPPGCGSLCETETDCQPGTRCYAFSSEVSRCVPVPFEEICSECGEQGCQFNATSCEVQCSGE